jgi:GxxExxY protein
LVSREGREGKKIAKEGALDVERLASIAIDCGLKAHQRLGPGLLETAYERILAHKLSMRGLSVETQVLMPIEVDGLTVDQGFRADILVERALLIEVKSIEKLAPVHGKQVLTYLRFMNLPLGLLMNFSGMTFREGLRRIVNNHHETRNFRLDMHQ